MSLGKHLCADQDVYLAPMDLFGHLLPLLLAARRIAVDAQYTRLWKMFGKGLFQPLCTTPKPLNILIATRWAMLGNGRLKAAVVATQAFVGQMQHAVGRTALAVRYPATGRTGEHRRVATPIKEDEALLFLDQPFFDFKHQFS